MRKGDDKHLQLGLGHNFLRLVANKTAVVESPIVGVIRPLNQVVPDAESLKEPTNVDDILKTEGS